MSFCVQGLQLLKKQKNQISFHRHFRQFIHFEKIKKTGIYGTQIPETGVPVIHTFNIFEESKMCHILTSNSTHFLIISGYIFLEEHYTMYETYYLIILE